MKLYQFLKRTSQGTLPAPLRAIRWSNRLTRGLREWILRRGGNHDEIYGREYHEKVIDPQAAASAPLMVKSLMEDLDPSSVVDVGCGTGQLLLSFQRAQVPGRGLEYSDAGLDICWKRNLDVLKFDLDQETICYWRADLVVSAAVAEHLPEHCADRFVDLLCSIADQVVITATAPGQCGTDQVNEKPPFFWIEKFKRRSFRYDEAVSLRWRRDWEAAGVAACYCRSPMLFRRGFRRR